MYSLVTELEEERKKYGDTMTGDQCVELLNTVLWNDTRRGYKLVEKKAGANGRRYDGALCSRDGLVWVADRTFVDVLRDAGGVSKPTWQVHAVPPHDPHGGPLIAAIQPQGAPPEPPDPAPPDPQPPATEYATKAELAAVEKRLTDQIKAMSLALTTRINALEMRVATLETTQYRVKGGTSREWGHGHSIDLPVEKV